MGLLFFWIISIIVSYGINLSTVLRIYKDLADEGYKINLTKLKESNKNIDVNLVKSTRLSMLIPFINILNSMKTSVQYILNPQKVYEGFRMLDVLGEMSDFEINEYKKNPSGINALLIEFNYDKRMQKASKKIVKGDFKDSIFTFDYGLTDAKELTILNVEGPAKNLSEDEQKDLLLENIIKETLKKDSKEFLKVINKENENISFSVIADSKNKKITINFELNPKSWTVYK